MFFVREQRVKIISILLLLNINCSLAESPASSYLPPNRDDQPGQFSSANPTGQKYNTNKAPIETSVSLTTSEPFSYNPSSFGDTRSPPTNTYGAPNSQNLPNSRIPSNERGSGNNNANDFNQGNPIRNQQQSFGGNSGYSYQQPSSPFKEQNQFGSVGFPNAGQSYQSPGIGSSSYPSTFGGQNYQSVGPSNSPQSSFSQIGAQNGGQSYQSAGPTNLPQVNLFSPVGTQNGGQGYQSANPTNPPAAVSSNYFSSPLPSLSPTYGVPSNTSGGYAGSSNLIDRKPSTTPPNSQPNSFRPSTNNQGPTSGNVQGFSQNFPSLSTNYGPPSTTGASFGNFPPFGGNFNPPSNPFGVSNAPLNQNRNPFSSSGPSNTPSGRPLGNFGPPNSPQTLYGPPTPNNLFDNANLPGRRPSNAFGGGESPPTQYSPPIQSAGDRFSPQGNRNGPPSPTYGPPTNTPQFGGTSQSFRPQEFERLTQNSRPFDNPGTAYKNSSAARPVTSQLYGAPFSNIPNAGYNQGQTQEGPYPSSNGPTSSISPGSGQNTYNSPQNQVRPSPPSFSPSSPGYSQNSQNQPPPPSPTYGLPQIQNNPSQSSFNALGNPPSGQFGNSGGYEAPRSPSNVPPSNSGFSTSGSYEAPRPPSNGIPTGSGFTTGGAYEAPRSPTTNSIPSSSSSLGNSPSPVYGTPSTNSFNQAFVSPNEQGYFSSSAGSPTGFGNISPTTEAAQAINSNSLSPSYSPPTRDYTDALLGDQNTSTFPETGNTFPNNPNPYDQYLNTGENTQPSQNPNQNQEIPAQSAYSAFSPPSPFAEVPSRLYEAPRPSNQFTNEEPSPQFTGAGSTNAERQSGPNFSTNPASSYLPPNPSGDNGISDDIVPSTSYTLQSDQPKSARPGASNTVKNTNRNVGSDLITGASTSPFLPFKDDLLKPNATPSRATYEKSQEITSNDLGTSGYDSAKPAKYQFNYDVKGSGPEFSHQESRNGTTTSGSYGVVLPDGRKQVVDYEANQEGFHPKIRYEETSFNSLQQNNNNDQSQNYNYSPNTPSAKNFSQAFTPNINSELQPPYPSKPDYSLGTAVDQGSYTSPYSQSGYTNSDQRSESNYNTYSNQGTSSSSPDDSYDSSFNTGYPAKSAPEQNIPFYT